MNIHLHVLVCMYVYLYVCMYVRMHACMYVCVYIYIYTHGIAYLSQSLSPTVSMPPVPGPCPSVVTAPGGL